MSLLQMEGEKEGWSAGRAHLAWLLFKKAFLQRQRFGAQRAALTGRCISPDLVCFGCFGAAAIMRDRGLVIERTRFHPLFPARRPRLPSPPACLLFPYLFCTFGVALEIWRCCQGPGGKLAKRTFGAVEGKTILAVGARF